MLTTDGTLHKPEAAELHPVLAYLCRPEMQATSKANQWIDPVFQLSCSFDRPEYRVHYSTYHTHSLPHPALPIIHKPHLEFSLSTST